jgi:hypothetical protein
MKSVKALLFVMVFSLAVMAGCSSEPTEVPSADDTVPVRDVVVPNTNVETTVDVEAPGTTDAAGTTDVTGTTGGTVKTDAVDTGVTTTNDSAATTGEIAE